MDLRFLASRFLPSCSTKPGDPQMESDWDRALAAEDCVRVTNLLSNNEKLLMRGCKEHKATEAEDGDGVEKLLGKLNELINRGWDTDVETSLQIKPQCVWKGRTALHVATRRGDVKLVELILSKLKHVEDGKCLRDQFCLLGVIDSDYELDALAMTVVNGNKRIVQLLKKASLDCPQNPYGISHNHASHHEVSAQDEENNKLSELIEQTLSRFEDNSNHKLEEMYRKDCDFNFLEMELFFFHFTFSTWKHDNQESINLKEVKELILSIQGDIVSRAREKGCLEYLLLKLWDGQGRTPLHVAVDSNNVEEFLDLMSSKCEDIKNVVVNATDSAGRTPLYRASATNQYKAVNDLLGPPNVDLHAKITYKADQWGLDVDKLSWRNSFKSGCVYIPKEKLRRKALNNKTNSHGGGGATIEPLEEISSTALHIAIILKREVIVEKIVDKLLKTWKEGDPRHDPCRRRFIFPVQEAAWKAVKSSSDFERKLSTMKLAVLVGSIPILKTLLKAEEDKPGLFTTGPGDEDDLPSFHYAAAMGNPEILKAFLDSEKGRLKATKRDCFRNTALHHALRGKGFRFRPHLVDFVGCHQVSNDRWEDDDLSDWLENPQELTQMRRVVAMDDDVQLKHKAGQKMGCVNLLLEAGIDIWEENNSKTTASPESNASEEFVRWWYQKVTNESQEVQGKLNAAANAISVTAALVATASYRGPMLTGDFLQLNILAVRIFLVCDNLSFYLALAAIMLALLPSLPRAQESILTEVVQTRTMVTRTLVAVAMACLFPSIICVFAAFAAAYFAVIPGHGSAHHNLIVTTSVTGGFFCLLVMLVFFIRLVKVLKDVRRDIIRIFSIDYFMKI